MTFRKYAKQFGLYNPSPNVVGYFNSALMGGKTIGNSRRHTFIYFSRYLAAQRKCPIYLTPLELYSICKRQKRKCALTGRRLIAGDLHLDHIIPKSRGGSNDKSNLRFLCASANIAKSNLLDDEFIKLCKDVIDREKHW